MNAVGKLVLAFVSLILGIALASQAATMALGVTDKTIVASEGYNLTGIGCYQDGQVNGTDADCNITLTHAPTSWKKTDCPLTSVTAKNYTETNTLTLDTDYNLDATNGIITMLNTTTTNLTNLGNEVKIGYTYCDDDYMNLSWGRTSINTSIGLFALGLFGVAIALFWSVAKEAGFF